MGLGYTLDHAASPVPVKGDQRDLISRYGEQPVQQAQAAWACLLDATAGAAFEERVLSAVTVRDAWCQILSWTGPSSEAEKLFLERQLETVSNYGDEDPKLFFSRVDQLLTRLRSVNVHKTEQQIVHILVRNLSDHYEIEKRSRLDSPFLRRQDVEHIVRASWATRKTRQLEQQSASGATPNPHALVASGGFQTSRGGYGGPRRGGGRSSGSGRGIQQSWSRGGGNHHANRQQQQQHPRSLSNPLTANFGLGGPFDGGTNAGGWPQEESPPSPNGSVPHCERCGRKGHMARICRAPLRFEGTCGFCGQYGHRMRHCIRNQLAPHAHVVAAPIDGGGNGSYGGGAYGRGYGDGSYGGGAYGRGYGDGSYGGGAYGYGGSDGGYSDGAYSGSSDHGRYGGAGYEAVPIRQSPGGGGVGYDIPSRPPAAPDRGYHRSAQQTSAGEDGAAFAAEDGGHEDEGYFGGPLSSVFGGPESSSGPTAYVLQLPTSEPRFLPHVMSAVFASKRPGATTVIGDSGASRHTFGDGTHVRNKRLPAAEEAYLIIANGKRLPVACYGDLDLVLHCERYGKPWSNVRVTLKNVAVIPGIWFNLISFTQIQEAHPVLLDKEGAHVLGSRILFTKHANGNYVQATPVAHDGSPAICLSPEMPATTVPSATAPPAMAAAVLRPGATTSTDINDLHVSLGHAHEGNLRETAKQMGIRVTGTLVPCSECAAAKGIRRSVPRSTARRATKPLELLYGDLSGAMPASTGGSVYCFFIVDCYSNLGWPIFLKNKSADTVTHAFRAFLATIKPLREKHGEPGTLRTDNGTEFVNEPFSNLLVQYGIRREFTSVDGPKRNGRVERRIALVKEGARAAWLGFPRLFPDVRFPSRTKHYPAVWPEAWLWMSENINITSRVDSPDKRCPEEKLYGKRLRKQLLPFLMPGHRTRGSGPKWAGKADPCFYLNGGNDHASDCDKVMLESGIVSYTTNATYAYRRVPFVGQQVTFGNGIIRAPSPPPAATSMGGSGTGGLVGQSGESDAATAPSPPSAASSAERGDVGVLRDHPDRREGIGGGTTFPPLSPVAPSTGGDTSGLQSQSEERRKSDRLDITAQQDNPRSKSRRHTVTPAVTRSAARAQLGVGDQPGAFTVLSAKESIHAAIATSTAPDSDSPELPTCPTCDLETPATHAQAHAGPHSNIWKAAEDKEFGGLRAVGTFEELGGT